MSTPRPVACVSCGKTAPTLRFCYRCRRLFDPECLSSHDCVATPFDLPPISQGYPPIEPSEKAAIERIKTQAAQPSYFALKHIIAQREARIDELEVLVRASLILLREVNAGYRGAGAIDEYAKEAARILTPETPR